MQIGERETHWGVIILSRLQRDVGCSIRRPRGGARSSGPEFEEEGGALRTRSPATAHVVAPEHGGSAAGGSAAGGVHPVEVVALTHVQDGLSPVREHGLQGPGAVGAGEPEPHLLAVLQMPAARGAPAAGAIVVGAEQGSSPLQHGKGGQG